MAPNKGNKVNKSEKQKKEADAALEAKTQAKPLIGSKAAPQASKSTHAVEYEFGGPIGALAVVVFLPLVVFALFFLCNKEVCLSNPMHFNWGRWIDEK